jgi:membrane protease YdiL (CAAX protease family)
MDSTLVTYIALGLVATVYAFALNTQQGKRFADKYTWASVVVGTSIVLVALWFLLPQEHWWKVVIAFVVSGTPMIARSLINKARK